MWWWCYLQIKKDHCVQCFFFGGGEVIICLLRALFIWDDLIKLNLHVNMMMIGWYQKNVFSTLFFFWSDWSMYYMYVSSSFKTCFLFFVLTNQTTIMNYIFIFHYYYYQWMNCFLGIVNCELNEWMNERMDEKTKNSMIEIVIIILMMMIIIIIYSFWCFFFHIQMMVLWRHCVRLINAHTHTHTISEWCPYVIWMNKVGQLLLLLFHDFFCSHSHSHSKGVVRVDHVVSLDSVMMIMMMMMKIQCWMMVINYLFLANWWMAFVY